MDDSSEQRIIDFLSRRRWAPTATVAAALGAEDVTRVLDELKNQGRVHSAPALTAREEASAMLWGVAPIPRLTIAEYMRNDPDRGSVAGAEMARRYGVSKQYAHAVGVSPPAPVAPKRAREARPRQLSPKATRVREILDALRERPMTTGEIAARAYPPGETVQDRQRIAKAVCWTLRRQWRLGRVRPQDDREPSGRIVRRWTLA
jgi:hypothetical protein